MSEKNNCSIHYMGISDPITYNKNVKGLIETQYKPAHSYYVYIFRKNSNNEIVLAKLNSKPYTPVFVKYYKNKYNRMYFRFDYQMNKYYYFYISGRQLRNEEIEDLRLKKNNLLIKFKPSVKYNKINLNSSFIVFNSMIQYLETYISNKEELVTEIINLFENPFQNQPWASSDETYHVLKWIKKNRYMILPNGK